MIIKSFLTLKLGQITRYKIDSNSANYLPTPDVWKDLAVSLLSLWCYNILSHTYLCSWEIPFSVTYSQSWLPNKHMWWRGNATLLFYCVLIVWTTFLSLLPGKSFASRFVSMQNLHACLNTEQAILLLWNVNCMIHGNDTVTMDLMCTKMDVFSQVTYISADFSIK